MSRLAAAIILLGATTAIAMFLVLPQWGKVGGTRAAIGELESLHEELATLAANRDALIAEYNTIAEADLTKLESIAPVGLRTTAVLTDFEELARRNSLALSQVEFSGDKGSAGGGLGAPLRHYGVIPVNLSLRGNYENFRDFLMALEHNVRIFDADEINFASGQGKETTVTLKGRIYYRR